jgi:hypothetical protein
MIPLIDYCFRGLTAEVVPLDIGTLMPIASRDRKLFVAHDPGSGRAAVVIPDRVFEIANGPGLHGDPFDELSAGQVIVDGDTRAVDVAEDVEDTGAWAVIATTYGNPVGLMVPQVIVRNLTKRAWEMSVFMGNKPLAYHVSDVVRTQGLAAGLAVIESDLGGFHSESVNETRPDVLLCADHGQTHPVAECPCEEHPGSPCEVRGVR